MIESRSEKKEDGLRGFEKKSAVLTYDEPDLEHLECSHQPHIQGQGAKKRTQRAR